MSWEFDDAIALEPLGDGRYAGHIGSGWRIGDGVNGGFLLAFVGRALSLELAPSGHPDPFTMSACFLGVPHSGPAWVEVTVLRSGGSVSVARATLLQDETKDDDAAGDRGAATPRIEVLALFGDLDGLPDEVATTAPPFEIAPLAQCIPSSSGPPGTLTRAEMLQRLDLRFDPATSGWAIGMPSGRGVIQAWFGFADGRPVDALSLLLAVDVLPPASFDLGKPGWAPTLELTVHVRATPAPGPLRVRHATRNVAGGQFEEDCEVWDSADRLVAQSRQLARLPRPRAPR